MGGGGEGKMRWGKGTRCSNEEKGGGRLKEMRGRGEEDINRKSQIKL